MSTKQLFEAFKLASHKWNPPLATENNQLLKENTVIRKEVESKLRKLFMGGVPWSPDLQLLWDTIELWSMLVRKKKQVKVSVKRIRRFLRKVPSVQNTFSCTLLEATHYQHLAFLEYKASRKQEAVRLLEDFQCTLAEALALKNDTDVTAEAENLRRIERQRRQARNVKRMRGKTGNSRVTHLWYTQEDGTRVQCTTQVSMELACFTEDESSF
jgi:hypothetical protein